MSTSAPFFFLEVLLLTATCLTVYKLFKTKLYRRYPFFFAYFLYRIPYTVCVLLLDVRSSAFFYFWKYTLGLTLIFYVLTIRELYGLVLERHRGIYTLGRWAIYLSVAVSVILSVLGMLPRFRGMPGGSRTVDYLLAVQRGVTLSLAISIVLMLFLLSPYASVLTRNVVVHAIVYAGYYISTTIATLLKSVFGVTVYGLADTVLLGVSAACVFCWFFLLTPAGEKPRTPPVSFGAEQERHLLSQLDQLNATLLKAGKH